MDVEKEEFNTDSFPLPKNFPNDKSSKAQLDPGKSSLVDSEQNNKDQANDSANSGLHHEPLTTIHDISQSKLFNLDLFTDIF